MTTIFTKVLIKQILTKRHIILILLINGLHLANAQTGGVGINTSTPTAALNVKGIGNTNATKNLKLENSDGTNLLTINDDGSASGTAYVYIRDGISQLEKITVGSNTGWAILGRTVANYGTIGNNAVDLSIGAVASTTRGATGNYAFTSGANTTASGNYSTALGATNVASGNYSTAFGLNSVASGMYSTAMGNGSTASGIVSTAMGIGTTASGNHSISMGNGTIASGGVSTAMGSNTIASGGFSTAMGSSTTAPSFNEVAVGAYNTDYVMGTNGATQFNVADRAFVVGIGTGTGARNDGLIIYKDGSMYLNLLSAAPAITTNKIYNNGNVLYINGTVVGTQTSDIRFKERIEALPSVLGNIKALRPVSYYWKEAKWGSQKEIGFIAQDFVKLFPEVVVTDADGFYKVNYGVLTSVLTKGMQEQQTQIDAQQKEIDELKTLVKQLLDKKN